MGFSLGLLWTKRPPWQGNSKVQNRQRFDSCRRSGFPTWSWTSLHADICQDSFGTQSKYGQYLDGTRVCFPKNEANIEFWCLVDNHPVSLRDAIAMTDSPILQEHSRELLVEGEFIRLRRNTKGAYNLFLINGDIFSKISMPRKMFFEAHRLKMLLIRKLKLLFSSIGRMRSGVVAQCDLF